MYSDYIHISPGKRAKGSFREFGQRDVTMEVEYDVELVGEISKEAEKAGISAGTLGEKNSSLDHGVMAVSYTHLDVYKRQLDSNDKIMIIDDFLAEGNAIRGLIDVAQKSGAEIMGIGIAIEKGFQQGGSLLRAEGYNLKSLVIVDELKPGNIKFRVQE